MTKADGGGLHFPPGFLLGCATAAHQIEGGNVNDWSRWELQPGRIRDGSTAQTACGHYERYREDLGDLARMGHNAHRFSVEWSRVEPEEGHFDSTALAHYADVVTACRDYGMEPVVTLHHLTFPLWLADAGGPTARQAPIRFARFAAACAEAFGANVRWWITMNEPVVLARMGYQIGEWPPGRRSIYATLSALQGMMRMHAAAFHAIHTSGARRDTLVGVAHHVRGLRPPEQSTLLDRAATWFPNFMLNQWFLRSCAAGRLLPPVGIGQRLNGLRGSLDFVGLNYYTEDIVHFDYRRPADLFTRQEPMPNRVQSTFGWAIEPDGLRRALHLVAQETAGLPVLVCENGVADEADELRPHFIIEHLKAILRAIAENVDVRGYFYWTAWDNFEWGEGYSQRFGLIEVDRNTLIRKAKPSAATFATICRRHGIPREFI